MSKIFHWFLGKTTTIYTRVRYQLLQITHLPKTHKHFKPAPWGRRQAMSIVYKVTYIIPLSPEEIQYANGAEIVTTAARLLEIHNNDTTDPVYQMSLRILKARERILEFRSRSWLSGFYFGTNIYNTLFVTHYTLYKHGSTHFSGCVFFRSIKSE